MKPEKPWSTTQRILSLYESGKASSEIAEQFNITVPELHRIIYRARQQRAKRREAVE